MGDKIDEAFGAWCEATFGEAITTGEYRFLKDGFRAGYLRAVKDVRAEMPEEAPRTLDNWNAGWNGLHGLMSARIDALARAPAQASEQTP